MVWILETAKAVDKAAFNARVNASVRREVRAMAKVAVLAVMAHVLVNLFLIHTL